MRPKARIFQVFTYTADRISDEPYKKLGSQLMIKGYSVDATLQNTVGYTVIVRIIRLLCF